MRHTYEHKTLSQWAVELRADTSPTSYLEKFSFSVSSLESYDQIPAPGGISVIELNELKLNLNLVKVLSEELNLKLDEKIIENTSVTNRKMASNIFSETISSLLQKGQQLPQTLRDTKKFQKYFIQNLLTSVNETCTLADQKGIITTCYFINSIIDIIIIRFHKVDDFMFSICINTIITKSRVYNTNSKYSWSFTNS